MVDLVVFGERESLRIDILVIDFEMYWIEL